MGWTRTKLLIADEVTVPITPFDRGISYDGRVWVHVASGANSDSTATEPVYGGMLLHAASLPGIRTVAMRTSTDGQQVRVDVSDPM